MQVSDFEQSAKTPELGGRFTDLILIITPWLKGERRELFQKSAKFKSIADENGKLQIGIDSMNFMEGFDEKILSLVIGWENLVYNSTGAPVPCTPENKKKYLHNMADELTVHKFARPMTDLEEEPKEFLNLFAYIDQFSVSVANYEKNSPGTVSDGNSGTKRGIGSGKDSPTS
jgi:hypothetical protein